MNEEIKAVMVELLSYLKTAADFAAEQAPLVLQEILNWGIASNLLWIIIGILFIALIVIGNVKLTRKYPNDDFAPLYVISGLGGFFILIGVLMSMFDVVQIIVAPRVYLIEYVGRLVGQ